MMLGRATSCPSTTRRSSSAGSRWATPSAASSGRWPRRPRAWPCAGWGDLPAAARMIFRVEAAWKIPMVHGAGLAKPLMVYDGDCHFCRRWIARWNEITLTGWTTVRCKRRRRIFRTSRATEFEREVKLIEPDGRARRRGGGLPGSRRGQRRGHLPPGPVAVCQRGHFQGGHGTGLTTSSRATARLFSTGTRWLWGKDVPCPTYFTARTWYLRGLAWYIFSRSCRCGCRWTA